MANLFMSLFRSYPDFISSAGALCENWGRTDELIIRSRNLRLVQLMGFRHFSHVPSSLVLEGPNLPDPEQVGPFLNDLVQNHLLL